MQNWSWKFWNAPENEVSKMFITSPGNLIGLESTPRGQEVWNLEYRPLIQPIAITECVVLERDKMYKELAWRSTLKLSLHNLLAECFSCKLSCAG